MNKQIAGMILAKGKTLAPDRFPAVPEGDGADMVLMSWSEALSIVALPEQVWSAAVTMWATSMVGDRMCTPRDLIHAAYAVRDRWDQDPRRRELLDEYRLSRLNANYERMGLEAVERAALDRAEGTPVAPLPSGRDSSEPARLGEVHQLRSAQSG